MLRNDQDINKRPYTTRLSRRPRWKDVVLRHTSDCQVSNQNVEDRAKWRIFTNKADHYNIGYKLGRKRESAGTNDCRFCIPSSLYLQILYTAVVYKMEHCEIQR